MVMVVFTDVAKESVAKAPGSSERATLLRTPVQN
jgi:hypothetical protein